eukprot:6008931-Prymnesium_polylepis.1
MPGGHVRRRAGAGARWDALQGVPDRPVLRHGHRRKHVAAVPRWPVGRRRRADERVVRRAVRCGLLLPRGLEQRHVRPVRLRHVQWLVGRAVSGAVHAVPRGRLLHPRVDSARAVPHALHHARRRRAR